MRANQFIVHILSYIGGYASWSVGSGDSRLRERRGYRRGRRSVWGGAAGSGFRRSAGTFDGKPRGGGKRSHPIAFGGGLFRPLTLRPFGRALSGWFRKNFFRSSFRVSSSRFKAVRMGFVRVVSKKASAFPSRVVLSHFKWRGVVFGGTCSKIICGRDE